MPKAGNGLTEESFGLGVVPERDLGRARVGTQTQVGAEDVARGRALVGRDGVLIAAALDEIGRAVALQQRTQRASCLARVGRISTGRGAKSEMLCTEGSPSPTSPCTRRLALRSSRW